MKKRRLHKPGALKKAVLDSQTFARSKGMYLESIHSGSIAPVPLHIKQESKDRISNLADRIINIEKQLPLRHKTKDIKMDFESSEIVRRAKLPRGERKYLAFLENELIKNVNSEQRELRKLLKLINNGGEQKKIDRLRYHISVLIAERKKIKRDLSKI